VPPEIAAQATRRQTAISNAFTHNRIVPEFAMGGVVPGIDRGFDSVMARMRPGEMVLTLQQQSNIARMAGSGVFQAAGVPGVQPQAAFASGGIAPGLEPPVINISLVIGKEDQTRIVVNGSNTLQGRLSTVKNVKAARTNRELR
jgi:hypothetical protein